MELPQHLGAVDGIIPPSVLTRRQPAIAPVDQLVEIAPREPFFLADAVLDPEAIEFPDHDFAPTVLSNWVVVKFFEAGRVVEADAGDMPLRVGELVMCDLERSLQMATVAVASCRRLTRLPPPVRVVRRAHDGDQRNEAERRKREQEAFVVCTELSRAQNLPMKVVRTEISHGGSKLTCFFASEERLDFRDLVRDMGQRLQARVEMRQVGVRDSTKVLGGVGPCGLQLCCNTFLQDFAPVSIRHAKDQGLVLNPAKISGVCGRLMCCLVYEEAFYRAHRKLLPKIGKRVMTPKGEGRVRDVDVLKQTARIEFPDRDGIHLFEFAAAELKPVAPVGPVIVEPEEPDEPEAPSSGPEEGTQA